MQVISNLCTCMTFSWSLQFMSNKATEVFNLFKNQIQSLWIELSLLERANGEFKNQIESLWIELSLLERANGETSKYQYKMHEFLSIQIGMSILAMVQTWPCLIISYCGFSFKVKGLQGIMARSKRNIRPNFTLRGSPSAPLLHQSSYSSSFRRTKLISIH
jgi:hypothetical protein